MIAQNTHIFKGRVNVCVHSIASDCVLINVLNCSCECVVYECESVYVHAFIRTHEECISHFGPFIGTPKRIR